MKNSILFILVISITVGGCTSKSDTIEVTEPTLVDSTLYLKLKAMTLEDRLALNGYKREWYETADDTIVEGYKVIKTQKHRYKGNNTFRFRSSLEGSDSFNVKEITLQFFDTIQEKVIKEVDLVADNPYINEHGFRRRVEPGVREASYFLMLDGDEKKNEIKEYLPKGLYDSIPDDLVFERALTMPRWSFNSNKYSLGCFVLDWNIEAFDDRYELSGHGYAVTSIVVWDSQGNEIFQNQFDGYPLSTPNISYDGKYIMMLSSVNPFHVNKEEWKLTIASVESKSVIYEKLILDPKEGSTGKLLINDTVHGLGARVAHTDNTYSHYRIFSDSLIYSENHKYYSLEHISSKEIVLHEKRTGETTTKKTVEFFQQTEKLEL